MLRRRIVVEFVLSLLAAVRVFFWSTVDHGCCQERIALAKTNRREANFLWEQLSCGMSQVWSGRPAAYDCSVRFRKLREASVRAGRFICVVRESRVFGLRRARPLVPRTGKSPLRGTFQCVLQIARTSVIVRRPLT